MAMTRPKMTALLALLLLPWGVPAFAGAQEDGGLFKAPGDGGPRRFVIKGREVRASGAPSSEAARDWHLEPDAVVLNLGCRTGADGA